MKRSIAILLSVVMLFTMLLPVHIFAGNDTDLQKAIVTAKELFSISDDYKDFSYTLNSEGAKKSWSLNWNNSTENPGSSINVRIDAEGVVLGYYSFDPSDYSGELKLPKIKKQEAQKISEDFIKKVNPKVAAQLVCDQSDANGYSSYSFRFIRVSNGLRVYQNYVNIQVNSASGKVASYDCEWNDLTTLPDKEKAISPDEAKAAYAAKLGLKLIYQSSFDYKSKKMSIYPVYTTVYERTYCIDALTAEPVKIFSGFYGNSYDRAMDEKALSSRSSMGSVSLSKEELDAIRKASKLLTEEQAEKSARDFKYLEITDEYKMASASLNPSWPDQTTFSWNMEFAKEDAKEGEKPTKSSNISVTLNATTGEVISFNKYEIDYTEPSKDQNQKPQFDQDQSKKVVEQFLKDNYAEKFTQIEYQETPTSIRPIPIYTSSAEQPMPSSYNFSYTRKANGILFPGNSITIYFNAITGKIDNFQMNWFDKAVFPSIKKVLPVADVYSKMLSGNKYELQYSLNYKWDGYRVLPSTRTSFDVYMVYDIKSSIPLTFDAFTGDALDYNGKPYKEPTGIKQYTDMSGHYAEDKVNALCEIGISLPGNALNPDADISQKDFVILMGYLTGNIAPSAPDPESQLDDLYNAFIQTGIIKKAEKAPDSFVKREDAVKFMIRLRKFDKVADMKDIFLYPFKDVSDVSPDLVGYVTIAHALGMVGGDGSGYFAPKASLSRSQGMVMIYNYLK